MISSLIFLAIFMVCYPVSTFRQSGPRIMTPNEESSNTLPQQNFPYTQINGSMMLSTPAPNPTIMSTPPPISTGTVPPTVSATITPLQVINSPVVFIFNESFILSGTLPASNPAMAPGGAPFSPSITTGTVISSPIQVVTSPVVPIINDSLMLSSSTLDGGAVRSSDENSVPPTALIIDPAFMMTGTSIPLITPAPTGGTTFISYIDESFMIQNPTENTVTTASPISVASPPPSTVTLPSLTTTTLGSDVSTPNISPVISGTPETAITTPISVTSPPPTTVTFSSLTTKTLGSDGSTPNIGPVTTGTPETATSSSTSTSPISVTSPPSTTVTLPLSSDRSAPNISPVTTGTPETATSFSTVTTPISVTFNPPTTVTTLLTTTTLGSDVSPPNIGPVTTGTPETATSYSTVTTPLITSPTANKTTTTLGSDGSTPNISPVITDTPETATYFSTITTPISVTSPPPTTVTLPLLTTTILGSDGSSPNVVSVTTGSPETATITTLSTSTPVVSGTIATVPLMAASANTASPSKAPLDSAVSDATEQPKNSSSRYQNLQLVCPEATADDKTETSTVLVEPTEVLTASSASPIVGIVFPSEIKLYLNISSLSSISVNFSTEPPVTEVTDDTVIVEVIRENERFNISLQDFPSISVSVSPEPPVTEVTEEAVEIIEGNESMSTSTQFQNIIFETTIENTVSEAPIYIDLSDPNRGDVDFGKTTSRPQVSSTVPPMETTTSTPVTIPATMKRKKFEEKCLEYYNIGKRITRETKVQVFIIGGENSGEKEFPHMAALGYGKQDRQQWLCGGSLISENYVITAAHCLSARSLGEVRYVRLGTTTLQTETLDSEDFNVIRRIPHPDYVQGKQYNDIALLQLDRSVNLSNYIAPICLSEFKDFTFTKLTALGWGRVEEEGNPSLELQKVELEYFPNDVCSKAYDGISLEDLPGGISEDTQICAGAVDGSRDTCQGDSGGPLQLQQEGRMYLAGITSFGIGCGRADSPGVYTRVSYYIPWIENIIW